MMYRDIRTIETGIIEFVEKLSKRFFLIPSFQRDFVWDRNAIIRLWESIYRFYPIGSILCWETDIKLNIHRLPGGIITDDAALTENTGTYFYILDGQQRATSLFLAMLGKKGNVRGHCDFDYRLFFDGINGQFFFANEYMRKKRDRDPEFLISMNDLFKEGPDHINKILKKQECTEDTLNNLNQFQYVLKNYRLPLTFIKGFDIPAVSNIYERINQEGKKLKSIDIMIARTFQNYQYLVEEDL